MLGIFVYFVFIMTGFRKFSIEQDCLQNFHEKYALQHNLKDSLWYSCFLFLNKIKTKTLYEEWLVVEKGLE